MFILGVLNTAAHLVPILQLACWSELPCFIGKLVHISPRAVLADLWQLPWGSWVHPGSPLWTWTLPAKMTLFQTLDFACVGCAKQSLVIPQNRGWVLSQWFRHTDRSLFCHASAAFQHNNMLRGNVGAWHRQIWSALYVTKETFVIWFFIGAFC